MEKNKNYLVILSQLAYRLSPTAFSYFKKLIPGRFKSFVKEITRRESVGIIHNPRTHRLFNIPTPIESGKKIKNNPYRYLISGLTSKSNKGLLFGMTYLLELCPDLNDVSLCGVTITRRVTIGEIGEINYCSNPLANLTNSQPGCKKKLLFVLPSFWRGGTEKATLDLVSGLMSHGGFDVWVVATGCDFDAKIHADFLSTGANIVYYPQNNREFPFTRALEDLVTYVNPDIYVIANSDKGYFALPKIKSVDRFKVFDVLHSEAPLGGSKEFEPYIDEHIAVSQYIKDFFIKNYKPNIPIRVIYNGVNAEDFKYTKKNVKLHKVIFLGRLSAEKRPLDFLRIARKVQGLGVRDLKFEVYGEGSEKGSLTTFIARWGLSNVKLMGFTDNPIDVMNHADCLILTSANESYALVVVEAMASGVCVISSDVGIGSEIITNGINGFVVESGNIESFVSRLIELIDIGSEGRETIRINARNTIYEKGLTFDKMVQEYIEMFNC